MLYNVIDTNDETKYLCNFANSVPPGWMEDQRLCGWYLISDEICLGVDVDIENLTFSLYVGSAFIFS